MRHFRWDGPVPGVVASLLVTALIAIGEIAEGPMLQWLGLLAAVPLLAASLTPPLTTALVSLVVTLTATGIGYVQTDATGAPASDTGPQLARLAFIALASITAVLVSYARERKTETLTGLTTVAEAAQGAIMRPIPEMVGGLRCTSLYHSSNSRARIGGDLMEVVATPFGTRALIGDVQGKGMDAVRMAGVVLGAFREVAHTEPTLSGLAMALNRSVERDARPEEFVTAGLLQMQPDGDLQVVTCGHPAPFVVRPSGLPAQELPSDPAPPLGMLIEPPRSTFGRLDARQRLVLVTDGLLEARRPRRWWMRGPLSDRAGEFFPAEAAVGREMSVGPSGEGLRRLRHSVDEWTGGSRVDDMALLVLERTRP